MKLAALFFLALPLVAQEVIPLPLEHPANGPALAEKVEERGKGGVVDRSITDVSQPTITSICRRKSGRAGRRL